MSVVVPAYNEEDRLAGMLEEAADVLEREFGALAKQTGSTKEIRHRKPNGQINSKDSALDSASEPSRSWEIIIVSDGSTDKTEEVAFNFARHHQLSMHPKGHCGPWTLEEHEGVHIAPGTIRVVTLKKNRGKGGAVIHGMRHVRGRYVVFADADGASRFGDLTELLRACQQVEDSQGRAVAVGSRAYMVGSAAVVQVRVSAFLV